RLRYVDRSVPNTDVEQAYRPPQILRFLVLSVSVLHAPVGLSIVNRRLTYFRRISLCWSPVHMIRHLASSDSTIDLVEPVYGHANKAARTSAHTHFGRNSNVIHFRWRQGSRTAIISQQSKYAESCRLLNSSAHTTTERRRRRTLSVAGS